MDQNQPVTTLRDGRLKATVWENTNESGESYHTVALAKTYEDRSGQLQDSTSFSGGELLRIAELAREAHGVIRDIRRDRALERRSERQVEQAAPPPSREDRPRRFRNRGPQPQPGLER